MKRLLLIEDDKWLGESYVRVLNTHFDIIHALDLDTALEKINEKLPDIIIADFMLDGRNSLELLHELSSYHDTSRIPVILCSTLGDDIKKFNEQLSHYGVVEICDKGDLTPDSLRRVVHEALAHLELQ